MSTAAWRFLEERKKKETKLKKGKTGKSGKN